MSDRSPRQEVSAMLRGDDFVLSPPDFALAIDTLDRLARETNDHEDKTDLHFAASALEALYRHLNYTVTGRVPK